MLQILLLGTPQIILDGNPIRHLTSLKSQALLFYLAMSRRPESRLSLAGLLWPEKTDTEARTNLRQAVKQLRLIIGDAEKGGYLVATRETVALHETLPLEVDAHIFEWMANAGLGGQIHVLQFAVDRYTGEFLNGLYLDEAYGFEEWMFVTRERLRSLSVQGLHTLAKHYAEEGEIALGLTAARRLLEIEPWREEAHSLMMQFLAWDGQTGAALAQFDRCCQMLKDELGVEPGNETRALHDAIRANQLPRKTIRKGEPQTQPVRLTCPNNLPPQSTPFIGRTRELEAVKRLLTPQTAQNFKPLVTLAGMGGVGKTRLAIQAGTELAPFFSDGVWFIELAATTDPAQVPQAIVAALGLHEGAERPPLENLQEHFYQRAALLILDNCEQVIRACAEVAQILQTTCPALTILTTSREALHLPGESVYPMPVMDTPDPQHLPPFTELLQYDSIRLFVERALASWPAFPFTPATAPSIAEICQQLDGIPLAIELAAVRVNALSVQDIARRLTYRFQLLTRGNRAAPPRHQTLLASVDWSYELLTEAERALLQRLSVFSGGWTLKAAEAICADHPDTTAYALSLHPMEILDILTRLTDMSLVQVPEVRGEETRYRLLETIRQYARRKLRETGEEALASGHHARFYLNLVIEANPMLRSSEQKKWTAVLATEQDNLRAALHWWLQTNPANAIHMAGLLGRYWDRKGFYTEGRETLSKVLALADAVPVPYKIRALKWASGLAMRQASYENAITLAEEGLALSREQGNPVHTATFLNILGLIASGQGNDRAAQQYFEENVNIQRAAGDPWSLAGSLDNLSNSTRALGDPQKALAYMLECLEITRRIGDNYLIANNLVGAAECYLDLNKLQTAQQFLEEAILIQQEVGDQQGLAIALGELGIIAWVQQYQALALSYHEKSLQIRQQIGDKNGEGYLLYWMGLHALERKDFPASERFLKDGLAIGLSLGNQRNSLHCIRELGHLAFARSDPERAVKLWAACQVWQEHTGTPLRAVLRPYHAAKLTQAREKLGPLFDTAWQAGCSMTYEQLVAYAEET